MLLLGPSAGSVGRAHEIGAVHELGQPIGVVTDETRDADPRVRLEADTDTDARRIDALSVDEHLDRRAQWIGEERARPRQGSFGGQRVLRDGLGRTAGKHDREHDRGGDVSAATATMIQLRRLLTTSDPAR
jgi:hypothetical protein